MAVGDQKHYDLIVIGAGAAGIPAALIAAERGARVLLVDAAPAIGGTFHLSTGHMSAAGTRIQRAKRIDDSPDRHFAEVMRISRGAADPALVRIAVDNAADTLHWLLDLGLELEPDHPIIHPGHEPYDVARTYWAPEGGMAILKILRPAIERAVIEHALTVRVDTRLVALDTNDSGAVIGVTLESGGARDRASADYTLLATGGFSADADAFSRHTAGRPRFGGGYSHSAGGGLAAALAIGASMSGGEHFLPTFAGVAEPTSPGGVTFATQTYPQWREPWEVYIDLDGARFVREDDPSVDTRERALLGIRDMTFWAIYDDRIRREAPSLFLLDDATVAERFAAGDAYRQADDLDALAAMIGVDEARLAASIGTYNVAITRGIPDPMGRVHRPLPIVDPPFYAVRHLGWSIVGFAGLDIDPQFRVLDRARRPIPGLYAAGEVIGFAKTSGNGFCGGMSVTPAMTFGRLFGRAIGQAARNRAAA